MIRVLAYAAFLFGSVVFGAGTSNAQPTAPPTAPLVPASAFGAREGIEDVSLSPDGQKISYIVPAKGRGTVLMTVDLNAGGAPRITLTADGAPEQITSCDWVSNVRLVCTLYAVLSEAGEPVAITRVVAINSDGSALKLLTRKQGSAAERFSYFGGNIIDLLPGDDNAILMGQDYIPEGATGSKIGASEEGYAVDRVDTVTLKTKRVQRPMRMATHYISDGLGNIRMMETMRTDAGGYDNGMRSVQYRIAGQDKWEKFGEYDAEGGEGFNPYAINVSENKIYGFEKKNGRLALFRVALDGSLAKEEVFSRPDVDVDGLVTLGARNVSLGRHLLPTSAKWFF